MTLPLQYARTSVRIADEPSSAQPTRSVGTIRRHILDIPRTPHPPCCVLLITINRPCHERLRPTSNGSNAPSSALLRKFNWSSLGFLSHVRNRFCICIDSSPCCPPLEGRVAVQARTWVQNDSVTAYYMLPPVDWPSSGLHAVVANGVGYRRVRALDSTRTRTNLRSP